MVNCPATAAKEGDCLTSPVKDNDCLATAANCLATGAKDSGCPVATAKDDGEYMDGDGLVVILAGAVCNVWEFVVYKPTKRRRVPYF